MSIYWSRTQPLISKITTSFWPLFKDITSGVFGMFQSTSSELLNQSGNMHECLYIVTYFDSTSLTAMENKSTIRLWVLCIFQQFPIWATDSGCWSGPEFIMQCGLGFAGYHNTRLYWIGSTCSLTLTVKKRMSSPLTTVLYTECDTEWSAKSAYLVQPSVALSPSD